MSWKPGWRQLASGLTEHGLDSLHWLGAHHGWCRGPLLAHLVRRLQGGGQVHQPLYLDAVTRSHVSDVVEVRGSADHLGSPVRVSKKELRLRYIFIRELAEHSCLVCSVMSNLVFSVVYEDIDHDKKYLKTIIASRYLWSFLTRLCHAARINGRQ